MLSLVTHGSERDGGEGIQDDRSALAIFAQAKSQAEGADVGG